MAHARVGSIPIELRDRRHVRSAPDSDRTADITRGPVCAQQRSHSILIATGEHWLQRSFGQPGSPQSLSVSRKIFGTPKRAYHVLKIGNT
jgi:hypothetical protein